MADHSAGPDGQAAEAEASRYLLAAGLKPVARNFHSRHGEIDLIMRERETLVFIEVRYRRQSRFGSAAESVTPRKQQRIITTAEYFLLRNPRWLSHPCRFDVLAISGPSRENIDWIRDAFQQPM